MRADTNLGPPRFTPSRYSALCVSLTSCLWSARGLKPVHPFEVDGSGRGACDIAGRVNTTNLIDRLATANGIAGGRQTVYTAALNWYVNREHTFYAGLLAWPCRQAGITHLDAGSKLMQSQRERMWLVQVLRRTGCMRRRRPVRITDLGNLMPDKIYSWCYTLSPLKTHKELGRGGL